MTIIPFRRTNAAVLELTEAAQLPDSDLDALNEVVTASGQMFITQMSGHVAAATGLMTNQVTKLTRGVEDLSAAFSADMKTLAKTLIIAGVCFTLAQSLLTAIIIAVFFL